MSLLTLIHTLAVGALLLAAGLMAEAGLRRLGLAARLVWLPVLAATVTVPLWAPLVGGLFAWPSTTPGSGPGALEALLAAADAGSRPETTVTPLNRARGWIAPGWLGLGAVGVLLVAAGLRRLHRQTQRWPRARVGDEPVLVSPDFGPAVVGLRRPRTVLPGWSLGLEASELSLIVQHEAAHRKARDPLVLAAGVFTAALAPWNPLLWLQVRRLREAVEKDCDRRLLRDGVSRVGYARMLLSMRARGVPGSALPGGLPVPGLGDTRDSLQRRLETMWMTPSKRRALPALAAAILLTVLACEGPSPTVVEPKAAQGGEIRASAAVVEVETTPDAPAPLIVVDGEPAEGAVALLETLEIESVRVLKGEAAVERYGEAGRDGVVEVVTGVPAPDAGLEPPMAEADEVVPPSRVRMRTPAPEASAEAAASEVVDAAGAPPVSEVRIRARPSTGAIRAEPVPEGQAAAGLMRQLREGSAAAPLVYVDGVRVDGVPDDLAPERIDRIEVIKGAAAVGFYGEEARDGVIRITTKGSGG